MFPTMCFLETLFLIIFGSFTLSSSIPEPTQKDYSLCAPFEYRCGDKAYKIYYPFRLPTSPDYCGDKEFALKCTLDNKTLVSTISNKEYQVNSIDYDTQIFNVTDLDFVDQSCVQTFTNTSFNPSLFNHGSGYVNLTLFFNCSPPNSMSIPNLYNITCPGSDSYSFYKLPNDPLGLDVWSNCNSMAFVPIDSSVLNDLITNSVKYLGNVDKFMGGLKKGFNLNWKVGEGWCSKCTESNGICWSDPKSQNSLGECYCSHGTTTNDGACIFDIRSSTVYFLENPSRPIPSYKQPPHLLISAAPLHHVKTLAASSPKPLPLTDLPPCLISANCTPFLPQESFCRPHLCNNLQAEHPHPSSLPRHTFFLPQISKLKSLSC